MKIGVPKEIKNNEFRVGLSPSSVYELTQAGHSVFVEKDAGLGSDFSDEDYTDVNATLVSSAEQVFNKSELIIKVKEPQAQERKLLKPSHTLFTYLHLAPDLAQTHDLLASGATCIAYEMVRGSSGNLPLLNPMSQIAGRMSIQAGAHCLEKAQQGRGVLLSGVPGVSAAHVLILGGGVVGSNAAKIAIGMGARVTILDKSSEVLKSLDQLYGNKIQTIFSTKQAIKDLLPLVDLVIGAVLIPGAAAPKLIDRSDLSSMRKGAALVDVAIDQGGCFETSRPTTHQNPIFIIDDIVHYCVANMPGGLARTATESLNNATLPYVLSLANKGIRSALLDDKGFSKGLSVVNNKLSCPEVGAAQQVSSITPEEGIKFLK